MTKYLFLLLVASSISFSTFSQAQVTQQEKEVKYLSKNWKEVPASEASFFIVKEVDAAGGGVKTRYLMEDSSKVSLTTFSDINGGRYNEGIAHGPYYEWYKNGQLKVLANYRNDTLSGEYKKWYESGQLHYKRKYKHNMPQDTLEAYYESGNLRRTEVYDKGQLLTGKLYNEAGEEIKFFPMEQMPAFPGGENALLRWLGLNITYPKAARKAKAQGLVVISFIVEKNGQIADAEVIRGFHPEADAEALRVVNRMPQWKPGLQEGEPVPVRYTLPVRFSIN